MANNKTEQAQNSVEAVTNAVGQVEDHPSDQMVVQAERSIRHAESAVSQALDEGESESAQQAANQLQKDKNKMNR